MLLYVLLTPITFSVGPVLADDSTKVAYQITRERSYEDPLGMISFDIALTLECDMMYTYTVDQVKKGQSTCHLNVAPGSGRLTVDYSIDSPIGQHVSGSPSLSLPQMLGDSPPLEFGLDIGSITVIIHGHLEGELRSDEGSISPASLEWTDWGSKAITVTADNETVLLALDTKYGVSFTVTVSIFRFPVVNEPLSFGQDTGDPSVIMMVPIKTEPDFEWPIPLSYMIAIVTAVLIGSAIIIYYLKFWKSAPSKVDHSDMPPPPPQIAPSSLYCPSCGKVATWIPGYRSFYCYTCKEYVEE